MKRRFLLRASTLVLAAGLIFSSCSTPQTRISEYPDLYQSLSPRDQALASRGQIRTGMSRTAVWLAWGSPNQKIVGGKIGGGRTETWLYVYYATFPCYPYYYPLDLYFGAPLYHPFYEAEFPPSFAYSGKFVTFGDGRVLVFQYTASH